MRLTTETFGRLAPYLIDLAGAFEEQRFRLMLVGGFGLVLRRQWRQEDGQRTLIEAVPPARATEDFDALLKLEMLENAGHRLAIREILHRLEYQPEPGMEYLHFLNPKSAGPGRLPVKVDFLSPPAPTGTENLKEKGFRVGPQTSTPQDKLHGYKTPEAELLLGDPLTVVLEGPGTDGLEKQVHIDLPHPFLLTLMKLRAFRDEYQGRTGKPARRDFAAKHVADVYALVSLLTQPEASELVQLANTSSSDLILQDAAGIVRDLLSSDQAPGSLLLRETLAISAEDLSIFFEILTSAYR